MPDAPDQTPPQMPPLVSLIMVAGDVAAYVGQALCSALAQALPELEIIVIDNGSRDGTAAIIARAARDPRLKVITNAANLGPGPGRNQGLAVARGTYIAFLDGDDWLAPGALARAVAHAEASGADLTVYGHTRWIAPRFTRLKLPPPAPQPDPDGMEVRAATIRGPLPLWRKFVRRSLIERIALPFPAGPYEDIRWSLRAVLLAERVSVLREPLYFYRRRLGSIINSQGDYHFAALRQWAGVADDADALAVAAPLRRAIATAMARQTRRTLTSDRLPSTLQYRYFREASAVLRRLAAEAPEDADGRALLGGNYMAYRSLTFPYRLAEGATRLISRLVAG